MMIIISLILIISSRLVSPWHWEKEKFKNSNIICYNENTLLSLCDYSLDNILPLIWFICLTIMYKYNIPGKNLLIILISTIVYSLIYGYYPIEYISLPKFDITIYNINIYNDIDKNISTFLIDILFVTLVLLFDISGVVHTFKNITYLENNMWIFFSVSIGTIISSILGGSPIIVHIESMSGILSGGRTGITSIVTGILFILCLIISPL